MRATLGASCMPLIILDIILLVVGLLWKFTSKPTVDHLHSTNRVATYLKRILNIWLHYQRFVVVLEGYINVDQNTLSNYSKATSSYIFSMVGGAVCWKFKKHMILSNSSMESEIISLVTTKKRMVEMLDNKDSFVWKPIHVLLTH